MSNCWTVPKSLLLGSDDNIRLWVKNSDFTNCGYITQICKKCGDVRMSPEGSTDKAKMLDMCKECFNL